MTDLDITRASGLEGLRRLVRSLGSDPNDILYAVGLTPTILDDPDQFLRYRSKLLAIERAAEVTGVSDFGLRFAEVQDISFLGALSFAIRTASSIRDGIEVASRHIPYQTPAIAIRLHENDTDQFDRVEYTVLIDDLPPAPHSTEHCVAHICNVVAVLSEGAAAPDEIHFKHAPLSSKTDYLRHLGKMPIFESDFDGILIERSKFRKKLPRTNQRLLGLAESFMVAVAPASGLPIEIKVRHVLDILMRSGPCGLNDVARLLRIHPRSLQRRLKADGGSFDSLHDKVRSEIARELLQEPALPLSRVALMLGYSEQSAFTRACRRWFGKTPRFTRRELVEK